MTVMRDLLIAEVKRVTKGKEKATVILFSGGMDSVCLLFCCLELGMKPDLYVYSVEGYNSPDLVRARKIAKWAKCKLETIGIPTAPSTVHSDIVRMLKMGFRSQVTLQCMHGHIYLAPVIGSGKLILNGSGMDPLYGVYKSTILSGAKTNKDIFEIGRAHV